MAQDKGASQATGLSQAEPQSSQGLGPSGFDPSRCRHGVNRGTEWCEPCFRAEQRERWGHSPWGYCDYLGRSRG